MQRLHTHKILIGTNLWVIKALRPIFFMGQASHCPVSMFTIKKSATMHEKVLGKLNNKSEGEQQLKTLRETLRFGVVSLNGEQFEVDNYLATHTDAIEAITVFDAIVDKTFSLKSLVEFKLSDLDHIDAIASRYSIAPIDVLFPCGEYTEMDAWIVNSIVASRGAENKTNLIHRYKLQTVGTI